MGDDDVRPGETPRQSGEPHHTTTIDGESGASGPGSFAVKEQAALTGEALPLDEPAMAAADLAAPDRPAESFSPAVEAPVAAGVEPPFAEPAFGGSQAPEPPVAPPPRRSMMSGLLTTIGVVLIALLAVNLYLMIEPPAQNGLAAVQARTAELDQRVATLEKRPVANPLDARVKALEDKLGAVAAVAAKPPPDADLAGRVTALDKAFADLRDQVAALPKPDLGPLDAKIADVAGVVAGVKTDLATLTASVAAIDHRLAPIETEFSAPKIAANVTEARQEGSAAQTRAAPVAVTAQAILQAIDEGKGFAPEVAALRSLGTGQTELAVLDPVAAKGVATKADLIAGFAAVRDAVVIAAAPVKSGTMLDRMLANAQSLVKVRHAGASAGGDTDAIVSRIDADLSVGDLRAALAEWNALPDAAKAPSAAWADQLKARVAAESTARAIAAGAITALGPTQ